MVMSAGKIALEETAKKFADMTATEVVIGFGDLFCDHRSPLAQVDVFKAGETPLDESAQALLDAAKAKHNKTKAKKELDKKFYGIEDKETEEEENASPDTPEPVIEDSNDNPDNNNNTEEEPKSNPVVETESTTPPAEPIVESTPEPEVTPDTSNPEDTTSTNSEVEDLINELDEFINGNSSNPDDPGDETQDPVEP